jgi:2-C-methyl-D-erythritol 4-phosphate cytidylyltransferase
MAEMKFDTVIVAAGSSTRFGGEDKLFTDLGGRPVLAWSLAAFAGLPGLGRLVVVTSAVNIERAQALAAGWAPGACLSVVAGGDRRRDSVEAGLRQCANRYVAIHDGARPLVSRAVIERSLAMAEGKPGAIAAVPVTDTLKEARNGIITGHPDRSRFFAAQTPQVVLRQAWLDAAAAGDDDETDDAAMLARLGLDCAIAEGDPENIKLTRPIDLALARLILEERPRQ